uniref:Uncharacterized protein n=1 Tax=Salarias fasciatus TaxID=181472 RepID=A0A672FIR9_SALFA
DQIKRRSDRAATLSTEEHGSSRERRRGSFLFAGLTRSHHQQGEAFGLGCRALLRKRFHYLQTDKLRFSSRL